MNCTKYDEILAKYNLTNILVEYRKAGIHGKHRLALLLTKLMLYIAKAILANPAAYEAIDPRDFVMQRYVHFASRLTGWNAIKSRYTFPNFSFSYSSFRPLPQSEWSLSSWTLNSLSSFD